MERTPESLDDYVRWPLLESHGYRELIPLGQGSTTEVYGAGYAPTIDGDATAKIGTELLIIERDRIENIVVKNKLRSTFPAQYAPHSIRDDEGAEYTVLLYQRLHGVEPGHRVTSLTREHLERSTLHLARNLRVIQENRYALADIKPSNILLGDGEYFIDFDAAVQFGQAVRRITDQYTYPHSIVASEHTDTYSFGKAMTDIALMQGHLHTPLFMELWRAVQANEKDPADSFTLDDIIYLFDTPNRKRVTRRKFLATAAAATFGAAILRYNMNFDERTQNGALDAMMLPDGTFDPSPEKQHELGVRLAHKIGNLVEAGVYSTDPNDKSVPGRFSPNGDVLHTEAFHHEGGAVTELLFLAAKADERVLPAAIAQYQRQINAAETNEFQYGTAKNLNVAPLLLAYEATGDTRALTQILKSAKFICDNREYAGSTLLLKYYRDLNMLTKKMVQAEDARVITTLLAAHHARNIVLQENNRTIDEALLENIYLPLATQFENTLRHLVRDGYVHDSAVFDGEETYRTFCLSTAQANLSTAYHQLSKTLENEGDTHGKQVRITRDVIMQPLLRFVEHQEKMCLKPWERGREPCDVPLTFDRGSLAQAYRVARDSKLPPATYSDILEYLCAGVPGAEHTSIIYQKKIGRKELLSGVYTRDAKQPAWRNIGLPSADANFLAGLLQPYLPSSSWQMGSSG